MGWDERFLGLAAHVAGWSKDHSSRVGACIVDSAKRIVSLGYNGFPQGVDDRPSRLADRETRLLLTIHAEKNAILFAQRPLKGCTLYCTHPPCAQCAAFIAQAGLARVVWRVPEQGFVERWKHDLTAARTILEENGVETVVLTV